MVEQVISTQTEQTLREIIQEFVDRHQVPSLGVGIVRHGTVQHFLSHVTSSPDEIETGRAFPVGSVTKSFAAAALLILRDEGKLSLEDSPANFVPELQPDPFWKSVTLRQLLSMQSGLGEDQAGSWAEQHLHLDAAGISELLARSPLPVSLPGTKYAYSNFSYLVSGRVITTVSGVDSRDFIRRRILTPLRLFHSSWKPPDVSRRVVGYIRRGTELYQDEVFTSLSDGAVFGGLWSTIEDLSRWMGFLQIQRNDVEYEPILSESSRSELARALVLCPPETDDGALECMAYGLGLKLYAVANEWHIGHSGAVPGFGCHFRWSPRTSIGVVAVGNLRYVPVWKFCGKLLTLVNDKVVSGELEPHPKVVERGQEILNLAAKWDDALAQKVFSPNVFLDIPRDDIKAGLERLGKLVQGGGNWSVLACNGLEARFGVGTAAAMEIAISPIEPACVQGIIFLC